MKRIKDRKQNHWTVAGYRKSAFSSVGVVVYLGMSMIAFATVVWGEEFRIGDWVVQGARDTGQGARDIDVSVNGQPKGKFSELKISHPVARHGTPQVFSVKGSGYLRAVPPTAEWGTSWVTTGYWNATIGPDHYDNTLEITHLDLHLAASDPKSLELKGKAFDDPEAPFIEAPDYTLVIQPPASTHVRALISYRLIARRDFTINAQRQAEHQGFKVGQFSSNFISDEIHDADEAWYRSGGMWVKAPFVNGDRFVFTSPKPMSDRYLYCRHSDKKPRSTPTCAIKVLKPNYQDCIPQGWVGRVHPNDPDAPKKDNVGLWVNWEKAKPSYAADEVIGEFAYELHANTVPISPEEGALNWIQSMHRLSGLVQSYDDEENAYIYDQALALILNVSAGNKAAAWKLARTVRLLQDKDGSWFESYSATDRRPLRFARYTGNVAWMCYALCYYRKLGHGESASLKAAERAGGWLKNLQSKNGGLTGGYDAGGARLRWKSTEHNIDPKCYF